MSSISESDTNFDTLRPKSIWSSNVLICSTIVKEPQARKTKLHHLSIVWQTTTSGWTDSRWSRSTCFQTWYLHHKRMQQRHFSFCEKVFKFKEAGYCCCQDVWSLHWKIVPQVAVTAGFASGGRLVKFPSPESKEAGPAKTAGRTSATKGKQATRPWRSRTICKN